MVSWRDAMPRGMLLESTPATSGIGAPEPGHGLASCGLWLVAHAPGSSGRWWLRSRVVGTVSSATGQRVVGSAVDVDGGKITLKLHTDDGPQGSGF